MGTVDSEDGPARGRLRSRRLAGLSGVALAAGGSAGSDAGPGLGLGLLVAPAVACDDAGALLGVVGAACQVGTAVLSPAAPAKRARYREHAAGRERSVAASPCGSTAAVLGDSTAGCVSGALAGVTQPRPASGTGSGGTAAGAIQRAVAPVASVLGVAARRAPRAHRGTREEHLR